VLDIRQIGWIRQQWKRFRRLLWGALGGVWLFCCVGILYLTEFQEGIALPLAMVIMLVISTVVGAYLHVVVYRRLKELDRMIIERRAEELREQGHGASGSSSAGRLPGC